MSRGLPQQPVLSSGPIPRWGERTTTRTSYQVGYQVSRTSVGLAHSPGLQRAAACRHGLLASKHSGFSFCSSSPVPLSFAIRSPAFRTPQLPPREDGTAMCRTVSPLLEREISSLWHVVLDELIPGWSVFAGCSSELVTKETKQEVLQQETLRSRNLGDEKSSLADSL